MMKLAFIAGMKFPWSPEWPFDPLCEFLEAACKVECQQVKHTDDDEMLKHLTCDVVVGHSMGAYDALEVFNAGVGKACLCLDTVNEDSALARLTLWRPHAKRNGVKSLHRETNALIYPRSVAVEPDKNVYVDNEVLEIDHGAFPTHPRTCELLVTYINCGQWTAPNGEPNAT